MTEPPELDHRTVSAAEMEKLLSDDHELQKRIGECRVQSITPEKPTHESFCIKKEISRFVDPISDDEVALITDYVNRDGSKSSVISRLRIGNTVYELEIPYRCPKQMVTLPATSYHNTAMTANGKHRRVKKGAQTAPCTTGQGDEYSNFSRSLAKVLAVSHKEMQKRVTQASAGRASGEKH